jgi:pimeloyl-ACP methyl ester carboxylesterase
VGAPRAVVGGLSMGAGTALRFALAEPARVRGIVLAAFPSPSGTAAFAERFADAIERDGLEHAGAEYVWGPRSALDPAAARLVRQGFLEHRPYALAHALRGVVAHPPAVSALTDRLRELSQPTLVVVGGQDANSLEVSRALVATLPHARLVVIPGAGHVVNLAAPGAFNAALEEFLGRLDGG